MDIHTVQTFFMWCTIINTALLILTGTIFTFAGDWVYRIQSKWRHIHVDICLTPLHSIRIVFLIC